MKMQEVQEKETRVVKIADYILFTFIANKESESRQVSLFELINKAISTPNSQVVVFRRTAEKLEPLWNQAYLFFSELPECSTAHLYPRIIKFKNASTIRFHQLTEEKDKFDWKGENLSLCAFDDLEDFTDSQLRYFLVRLNRGSRHLVVSSGKQEVKVTVQ